MRHIPTGLAVLALGACVDAVGSRVAVAPDPIPEGQVRVASVAMRLPTLVVTTSNGARCVAERPEASASGWSGTTADCPYAIPFVVTFARGAQPSRFSVEAPGAGRAGAAVPDTRAEIFVTDLDGVRRLFMVAVPERLFAEAPTG